MSKRLKLTIGQGFLPLWHNTDPFVLVESPRGCLKTCTILNLLMSRAYQWPGKRWYIWRSARTLLSNTVLKSFEDYVVPLWRDVRGMQLLNPGASTDGRKSYLFANGSEFVPVGLDDIQRGTSSEGAGGYLAEAIELQNRDQATALTAMMRQPGVPFHQIIVDANPGAPGHWLNKAAEKVDAGIRRVKTRADYDRLQAHNSAPAKDPQKFWKRIIVRIQDNPHYFDVEKWELTAAGKQYMKSLGVLTGHLEARWVGGEWRAPDGGVYPEFSEEHNVIKRFKIPATWPIITGYDPGFDHPCAWLWFAIAPNNTLYVVEEIVGTGVGLPQLSEMVKTKNAEFNWTPRHCYGDPQYIHQRRQESKTVLVQMGDLGISLAGWPRTGQNMDPMVAAVRKRWMDKTLIVCDNCTQTIESIQGWQYKRTSQGDPPATDADKYEQNYKDVNDVIRGIVAVNPVR